MKQTKIYYILFGNLLIFILNRFLSFLSSFIHFVLVFIYLILLSIFNNEGGQYFDNIYSISTFPVNMK